VTWITDGTMRRAETENPLMTSFSRRRRRAVPSTTDHPVNDAIHFWFLSRSASPAHRLQTANRQLLLSASRFLLI